MTAGLVDELADVFLVVTVPFDQLPIGFGLLDRVQILALDILNERDLGGGRVVDLADDRGTRAIARSAPPASGARPR